MRLNHLSSVMPVPGLDPGIVAGIHVLLAGLAKKTWMAGTSLAMTPNKWCAMTETSSNRNEVC